LSLAIGKDGQNVRLAAHLTGWNIDIAGDGSGPKEEIKSEETLVEEEPTEVAEEINETN